MSRSRILLDFAQDTQLVEWDFRDELPLLRAAARAAEPCLHERPPITVFGKQGQQQRDVAFFSDVSAGYYYSRQVMPAQPLNDLLRQLLVLVNSSVGAAYNGILVNKYRTGQDNVGSHSDSEHALDVSAGVIALSVGATRIFRLRTQTNDKVGDFDAQEGFGLQMRGNSFQRLLKHEIPRQGRILGARVSFTFRTHLPEHEQRLRDIIHTQEDQKAEESRPRSRSPRGGPPTRPTEERQRKKQPTLVFRLIGQYALDDLTLVDSCVAFVLERAAANHSEKLVVIAWDGDPYKPDNFTAAIPRLCAALPSACFVAFKLAGKSGRGMRCPVGFRCARGAQTAALSGMRPLAYDDQPSLRTGAFIGITVPVSEAKTFAELGLAAMRWLSSHDETEEIVVVRTGRGRRSLAEADTFATSLPPQEVKVSYVAV